MISHLLSKLPEPRPADWGFKVSVCIAVRYSSRNAKDRLILVTDNRVAFGDFSGEYISIKQRALWHSWDVMFAGNDVEHAEPIMRVAKANMIALAKKKSPGDVIAPEEATDIVDAAYSEHLQAQIENKILRKRQFTSESFKKLGKLKCTPEVYAKVWDQIGKEHFSLHFLVTGHTKNGEAQIWLVDGENAPVSYNTIGFWAIGKGAPAALSRIALYLSKYKQFTSLEEALYVAVTAKFAAECASDVGRSTAAVIFKHFWEEDDAIPLSDAAIDLLRFSWDRHGVPPVPKIHIKGLRKYLPIQAAHITKELESAIKRQTKRSGSQKSKPGQ